VATLAKISPTFTVPGRQASFASGRTASDDFNASDLMRYAEVRALVSGALTVASELETVLDARNVAMTPDSLLAWGRALPRSGRAKFDLEL